jgi:hypothetical protein
MAIKPTKVTGRKKPAQKVRDLLSRKDPRGGAQRKEAPNLAMGSTRGVTPSRSGKNKLS